MDTSKKITSSVSESILSTVIVLGILFVLPQFGEFVMMVGCSAGLSLLVIHSPDQYRSRTGALNLAIGLIVFLWVLTGIVGILNLMG